MADTAPPVEADLRTEDHDYNVAIEPKSSKAWINLLEESEKAFEDWNERCDNIDKAYANLAALSNLSRDKQFQMFWANMEVVKPSIYAKKPQPVVVPKFKDRRPVYQEASEVAERCATVAFDIAKINETMLLVRDDLAMLSRGAVWCRYVSGKDGVGYDGFEHVCIDFKNRRDFLHSVSRNWSEVTWVAGAAYLTRSEARKRFHPHSGDAYQEAEYKVDRDAKEIGGADARERAKFWEIWHKPSKRVLWVAKGCEDILDEDDPHLDLQGFFPCPKPAYGALQRGSLVPVPDVLQYKDQLEELNSLTGRIHALSESLVLRGFYPAGGGEISDAVQAALKTHTPGQVLVPISNWASFGGSKEVIIWMPIEAVAQTITALVALRKEIIQDIYQVMGLSDIMRGSTDPDETLGAQQMKREYGSSRIRDKQAELVRLARDLNEIVIDIITDKFSPVTIIEMSQTQLPTKQMVEKQIRDVMQQMQMQQQQVQQLMQQPQVQQMAQQQPEKAQQAMQQFQKLQQTGNDTITKLKEKPTIDQVLKFLKDNRAKAFVLDIETDSTINIDEQAEKQSRTEFVQVLGGLLPQLSQLVAAEPATADVCGEILKFATAPFRAGRSLDGAINELTALMKTKSAQERPDPEKQKLDMMREIEMAKIEAKKGSDQADMQLKAAEIKQKDAHKQAELQNARQIEAMRLNAKRGDQQIKMQESNLDAMQSREEHQMHVVENQQKMALNQQKAEQQAQQHQIRSNETMQRAADRRAAQQFKMSQPPRGS
jgi:hypothetical protein